MAQRISSYLKETRSEMKKVNWPTRTETIRFTIIVIVVSLFVAAFLGGLDYLFRQGLFLFIQ